MKLIHHLAAWAMLPLAGCATVPLQIPDSHPANSTAGESQQPVARPMLAADEHSRRTQTLLEERVRQAKAADAEADGTMPAPAPDHPTASPAPMPKMDHSGMSMPMDH